MYSASTIAFLYAESPVHAGAGRSLGSVDLPIQRERTTNYPIIHGSGVKGQLRSVTKGLLSNDEKWLAIFGPETDKAGDHAGALSIGDARILLFPVRSLKGVFAWTTSHSVLARFARDTSLAGVGFDFDLSKFAQHKAKALVSSDELCVSNTLVLEEYSFDAEKCDEVRKIGKWLSENALIKSPEYAYWANKLPEKLCILPDDDFRDFTLYATEIQTNVKINPDTKTVADGALWTTELLPVDSLLYAPLLASDSNRKSMEIIGEKILEELKSLNIKRIHLGGNSTTGQGIVALRIF